MTHVSENVVERRRGRGQQLSSQPDTERSNRIIDESPNNSRFQNWTDRIFSVLSNFSARMHQSTKTALIAVVILACVIVVIFLLSIENIRASFECININGEKKTCHATDTNPYRFYGTKTAYHIARLNDDSHSSFDVGECVPKVFYLLCRHATRYPDKDNIIDMIELLPEIRDKIHNNSNNGEVKLCKTDLENLKKWIEKLKPEFDNKITSTGINETIELAERFKAYFPNILGQKYSPGKFVFEYTSRERTRSTAEAFASGLFGEEYKRINFDNLTNDEVLQFHKDCKIMQKDCKESNYDTSEIDKFENGPLMQKVVDSVSERIGVPLTFGDIKIIHKACVFGYAVDIEDTWCSLFTSDELKVLEFNDDIDDYYKDAYGNKINYEQACPSVEYIMDLFNSTRNTTETKAVFQFSHAGGVKKVFSIFGLFKDEQPLTADNFCSQQNRKWRSSLIAPFASNLALVLYDCGTENKIAAFHNEMPVQLGGCSSKLCSFDEFYNMYNPVAEKCDLKGICSTCGIV